MVSGFKNEVYIVSNDFLSSKRMLSHYVNSCPCFFFDIVYMMMPRKSPETRSKALLMSQNFFSRI